MSPVVSPDGADGAPGWYGKLAALGDFAQRRLPAHWVRQADPWLAGLMRDLPATLGPQWLDLYLTAPVLRFAWAPGVVDMRWWFGVLMPSCDNVGRYFPLVIAQSRTQPPVDRAGLDHLERWYTVLARAAMHTLDDDASVERFEQMLEGAPAWPGSHAGAIPAPDAAERWQTFSAPVAPLPSAVGMLAAGELLERLAGTSVWSAPPAPGANAQFQWGPGLPASDLLATMLRAGRP